MQTREPQSSQEIIRSEMGSWSDGELRGPTTRPGTAAVQTGLETQEIARTQTIGLVFFAVCGLTTIWAPMLDGDPSLKIFVIIFQGQFCLFSLVVYWIMARSKTYSRVLFRFYGLSAVMASTMVLIYLGPFSPTALAVTLGISFFGQGVDRVGAWAISIAATGAYFLLFVLILTGTIPDVGVFRGDEAGLGGRIFMMAMVPLVLLVTLMQARGSKNAVKFALQKAVESTMEAGRKGAQLEEAQAELDRIAATGGVLGRMSGKMVDCYKLGRLLGRGGGGEVYDAIDTKDSAAVAVKLLNATHLDDPDLVTRFQREGQIATRLVSNHVARLHQYGQAPGGILFIAMERLEGSDLAAILRRESRLNIRDTQKLVHDMCQGISKAHALGIIHRDIKPHNIFCAKVDAGDDVWKVLDFGVSKLSSDFGSLTHGKVVGTPQYMSPEQARGDPVDVRTDIYGMGAVLYRVLTGRPPVSGRGQIALLNAMKVRPERPRAIAPDISKDLEAVLALALASRPKDRFATLVDFRNAFDQAVLQKLPESIHRRANQIEWKAGKLKKRSSQIFSDTVETIKMPEV
jgi:eukaryotic-like serine/threonine-protein kinase